MSGNWTRKTDVKIRDESYERESVAYSNRERYNHSEVTVDDHSTEFINGVKVIDAVGAVKVKSGGSALVVALDNVNIITGRSSSISANADHTVTAGGEMMERIEKNRTSIVKQVQRLQAAQTWIGSEQTNVLQVLADTLSLIADMNGAIATHQHGSSPAPNNAGAFGGFAGEASSLAGKVNMIKA
ncbi:hypothetical protein D3C81_1550620 [compost metagenome]